ncbi:MAG: hypothetical protein KC731_20420, partial [Myxococcales bacterium]|nr:hypothetical protein [Myxococcales bacterium]
PFFESDLAHAADVESCDAVLQSLATDAHVPLEVGLVWDPAPIRPPHAVPQLDDLVGELCVWASQDDAGAPVVEYLHIDELTRQRIRYRDAYGQSRVHPRDDAEAAIHRGDLGPVGPITAYAPKRLLEALGDRGDLSFWLHPSWRFEGDRPQHRPLHAKLVLLRHTHRGREETLVLLGSPNPSRGALLLDVAGGGNVELAVAFALEGHHHLADICPELVRCDAEALTLEERPYRAAPPNLALWIESAVHDAADGSLLITWRDERPHPLPAWRIDYLDRAIASGEGRPDAPTLVTSFTLSPASCEIVLVAAGERYPLPITVRDLVALPSDASLADLSLEELLALLGRRIGGERLASLREAGGGDGAHHALEAIFGEGFAPTDVFRAWWSIADHLGDPRTTLGAFRGHVEGSLGAQAVWQRLHDTLTADDEARRLTRDEIWFYGAELLRTLRPIVAAIPEGPDAPAKRSVLATFLAHLEAELVPLSPDPTRGGWVAQVIAHYAVGGAPA